MTDLLKRVCTCLQILNFNQTRQLRHDDIDIKNNQFYKTAEFNIDFALYSCIKLNFQFMQLLQASLVQEQILMI